MKAYLGVEVEQKISALVSRLDGLAESVGAHEHRSAIGQLLLEETVAALLRQSIVSREQLALMLKSLAIEIEAA